MASVSESKTEAPTGSESGAALGVRELRACVVAQLKKIMLMPGSKKMQSILDGPRKEFPDAFRRLDETSASSLATLNVFLGSKVHKLSPSLMFHCLADILGPESKMLNDGIRTGTSPSEEVCAFIISLDTSDRVPEFIRSMKMGSMFKDESFPFAFKMQYCFELKFIANMVTMLHFFEIVTDPTIEEFRDFFKEHGLDDSVLFGKATELSESVHDAAKKPSDEASATAVLGKLMTVPMIVKFMAKVREEKNEIEKMARRTMKSGETSVRIVINALGLLNDAEFQEKLQTSFDKLDVDAMEFGAKKKKKKSSKKSGGSKSKTD